MPRIDEWPTSLVMALPLAIAWAVTRDARALQSADAAQTFDLVFGVLMLALGVHARNFAFQHASSVLQSASLPMRRRELWSRALARQQRLLLAHYAVGLGVMLAWGSLGAGRALLGVLDWTCMCSAAAVAEPLVSGATASWGRRFPTRHPISELQRSLGGGWTRPEAVVHLYAGAAALALTAVLAMPVQLTMLAQVSLDNGASVWVVVMLALSPLLVLPPAIWWGRRWYGAASFESTPWLHEATRTLAGPPAPERAPFWIQWVRDPVQRFRLLQFCRTVSLPTPRLLAPAAWALFAIKGDDVPGPLMLSMGALLLSAWLAPALRVTRTPGPERLPWQALPRRSALSVRSGRALPWTWSLLPVLLPLAAVTAHSILKSTLT